MSYYRAYHALPAYPARTHIPLHGGGGIRSERNRSGGTLGGIVLRNGKPHILTNLHVVGAYTGQYVIQAAPLNMRLGKVTDISSKDPEGSYVDAALAATVVPSISEIPGIGVPRGHTEPKKGMRVKMWSIMHGRGLLRGTILDDDYDEGVSGTTMKRVKNAFTHTMPVIHGDSGSLVFNEQNMVVGINSHLFYVGGRQVAGCNRASSIIRAYPGLSFVGRTGVMQAAIAEAVPLPAKRVPSETTPPTTLPNTTPAVNLPDILGSQNTNLLIIGGAGLVALLIMTTRGR